MSSTGASGSGPVSGLATVVVGDGFAERAEGLGELHSSHGEFSSRLKRTLPSTSAVVRRVRMAVFEWIEGWYDSHRRHSSISHLSPIDRERPHATTKELGDSAPEPSMLGERRRGQEAPGLENGELSTEPR